MRRLEVMQWLGLLLGAAVWGAAHLIGYGTTEASCNSAGAVFTIDVHQWEGVVNGVTALLALAAGLSATALVVRTRGISYEDAPPLGRIRFFAIAALIANLLFLVMIVLYAAGSIANTPCVQS
jgi:hypothetical protein